MNSLLNPNSIQNCFIKGDAFSKRCIVELAIQRHDLNLLKELIVKDNDLDLDEVFRLIVVCNFTEGFLYLVGHYNPKLKLEDIMYTLTHNLPIFRFICIHNGCVCNPKATFNEILYYLIQRNGTCYLDYLVEYGLIDFCYVKENANDLASKLIENNNTAFLKTLFSINTLKAELSEEMQAKVEEIIKK